VIDPNEFVNELKKNDLNFFTGVPDSLLKDLCLIFEKKFKTKHYVAANEGSAIAIGLGYYLKTKKIPVIYLQNSGLGNAINPLISLADPKVYRIPLFLIIGWRGEHNKMLIDEPQHIAQGRETLNFLKNLKIKYKIISAESNVKKIIKNLKDYSEKKKLATCILVRKNTFKVKKSNKIIYPKKLFLREELLKVLVNILPKKSIIISTTGILSRELNEILNYNENKLNNFMCVGGMGHAISIATGIAINSRKKVFCFDGDGALTMHMGSLTTSAKQKNIVHIMFNNHGHESVGGQKTSADNIQFYKLAKILGYKKVIYCKNKIELKNAISKSIISRDSFFIEVLCRQGHRKKISRPITKMIDLKEKFIKNL
jgi:phosphonopyruvate decarboxylase